MQILWGRIRKKILVHDQRPREAVVGLGKLLNVNKELRWYMAPAPFDSNQIVVYKSRTDVWRQRSSGLADGACTGGGECGLSRNHAGFSVSKSEKASWQPTPLNNRSGW
jgi:hypothetical protein